MRTSTIRAALLWLCAVCLLPGSIRAGALAVDKSQSRVEAVVDATGGKFTASLEDFKASVALDGASKRPLLGTISWDFKDLKTGKTARDKAMLDWLEYSKYPEAVFTIESCDASGTGLMLHGSLRMHGVAKSIVIPLTVSEDGGKLVYDAEFDLDHRDYGLKKIVKFLILSVNPVLHIRFHIVGAPSA